MLRARLGSNLITILAILTAVTGCGWFLLAAFAAIPPRPTDPGWASLLFGVASGAALLAVGIVVVWAAVLCIKYG
jgi:hypothetical protein